MSVSVSREVWERSRASGSARLVLLAIADQFRDQGGAYPSVATLARQCRMSERQVRRIIDSRLEPSGELVVERRPGRPHRYTITLDPGQAVRATPDILSDPDPGHFELEPRTFSPGTSDIAMSDEPWNHRTIPPTPRRAGGLRSTGSNPRARAQSERRIRSARSLGASRARTAGHTLEHLRAELAREYGDEPELAREAIAAFQEAGGAP